jgi:TolB-like protein/Flp pilus assembly protein TadD
MSGDPEQEYFADGIAEDIITALSHIRRFFVIARNTTFTYKGQAVDVKKVADDLGVRYVLEGSVRKSGPRVRITAQLIDGATGNHIWAERYDRELEDIFELQDEITLAVAGAIEPEIVKVELERATKKSPNFLDALDCYYKGMAHISRRTSDDYLEARKLFERAISLDPKFGPAYEGIAVTCWFENMSGLANSNIDDGLRAARKAVELDDKDASAHTTLGRMFTLKADIEAAIAAHERALQLNPSSAASHYNLARAFIGAERGEEALTHAQSAIRLSPYDTNIGSFYSAMCSANLSLKRNEEAAIWGRKAIRSPVINWPVFAFLTAALAHLGEFEEAKEVLNALEQKQPGLTTENVRQRLPVQSVKYMSHLIDGLIKAGMPE